MRQQLIKIFELSALCAIVLFTSTYITIYQWQADGFDLIEASFLSILTGAYFVILLLIVSAFGINWTIRLSLRDGATPWSRLTYSAALVFISLAIFFVVDSVYFFLVDNSISADYGQALADLSRQQHKQLPGMDEFKNMPFSLQNGMVTAIFGVIGSLLSLVVIRKDGELFRSQTMDAR